MVWACWIQIHKEPTGVIYNGMEVHVSELQDGMEITVTLTYKESRTGRDGCAKKSNLTAQKEGNEARN